MAGIWFPLPGNARRLVGGIGALLLVTVLLACRADGHEPGTTDLASVTAIVDRLAVSDDPRREFSELPDESRQAVVDYLKLEEIESSASGGPTTPIDAPDNCERQASGYVARNAHGRALWTYESITEWCWADGIITTTPVFTINAEIQAPLWEFAGHVERQESGGQGQPEHADVAEGLFKLCPEAPDDCVQDESVRVKKWRDGDGGYGSETSEIDYSPDRSGPWTSPAFYLVFLVYVPLAATPLIAARVIRRKSPRGSAAWGLGVIATALGMLVALYVVLLVVYAGIFSIGSLFGPDSTSVSMTTSVERVEVMEVPIEEKVVAPVVAQVAAGHPGGSEADRAQLGDATSPSSSAGPGPRADECSDNEVRLTARNLFDQPVWSYRSGTWWCWDGVEITNEPNVSARTLSQGHFWNLVDDTTEEYGGQGEWTHSDTAAVTFELCVPLLGCTQRDNQLLQKSQHADGSSAVDDLPHQDSYPMALFSLIGPLVVALTLLVTGRVLRQGAERGELAWGFGVSATSLGLLMLTLLVVTGLFFVAASHSVA
ncbi:MAG: hypothetical protein OXR64_09355 [Chloroflexota bacterium]|nr:hypothetical protein [Chloroflexota bacterium]MDE2920040.1 hypothetical protein [Chloroflexota bacterium]